MQNKRSLLHRELPRVPKQSWRLGLGAITGTVVGWGWEQGQWVDSQQVLRFTRLGRTNLLL